MYTYPFPLGKFGYCQCFYVSSCTYCEHLKIWNRHIFTLSPDEINTIINLVQLAFFLFFVVVGVSLLFVNSLSRMIATESSPIKCLQKKSERGKDQ